MKTHYSNCMGALICCRARVFELPALAYLNSDSCWTTNKNLNGLFESDISGYVNVTILQFLQLLLFQIWVQNNGNILISLISLKIKVLIWFQYAGNKVYCKAFFKVKHSIYSAFTNDRNHEVSRYNLYSWHQLS